MLERKWIAQVSKTSINCIRKIISGFRSSDDTVEGQSKAFRVWMFSSTAAILMMLLLSFGPSGNSEANPDLGSQKAPSLIDQVPDGFVLVPIEPLNFETIDALIENHAYVDLYQTSENETFQTDTARTNRGKKLLARGLPMVRAPKNPSRFAVLVKDADSEILTGLGSPVLVVVRKRPPKIGDREIHGSRTRPRSKSFRPDLIVEEIPETENLNQ